MRHACLAFALFAAACAPTIRPSEMNAGDVTRMNAEAAAMVAQGQSATTLAEVTCAPLLKHQVSWAEERAIGQELAITLCAQRGHFYLDGATEKNPQKLMEALAKGQPVTLPESGKNEVSAHVAVVGKNLAHFSARPDLPWVFGVIENDAANAFNTPGGYVFVTTGLLKKMTNEAQLAGVLAHEISHVVRKDTLKLWADARHRQCIAANYAAHMLEHGQPASPTSLEAARYAKKFDPRIEPSADDEGLVRFIMQTMLTLVQLGHDKDSEFLTDKAALELISFAGYDALEYEKFLVDFAQDKHPAAIERASRLEQYRKGELRDFVHGTAKPDLKTVFAPLRSTAAP